MISRRIILAAVAAGATAAVVAGAVPAYAVTTVAVKAGTAPSGTSVAVKGAAGTIALKDLTTNATGSCTSSALTGTTKAGANSPSNVAQINAGASQITYSGCKTLGLPFTIAGVGTTTKWTIAATGNTASGKTAINITGVKVSVSSSSCTFTVSGSAAGTYTNGNPSTIAIPATTAATSKLVVSNIVLKGGATKCLGGAVTNTTPGNKISLSGTYNLTATTTAYNPITVTAT